LREQGREIIIGPQVEARLLAAAKQPLRDVIVIMQDTGMRPQDVFQLRWEHVNWQKDPLHSARENEEFPAVRSDERARQ